MKNLSYVLFAASAIAILAYLGACAKLVAGDTGGAGEPAMAIAAVLLAVGGGLAYRYALRGGRIS